MNTKVKLCMIEGCFNPVWSKGLCKNHVPKKRILPLFKNSNSIEGKLINMMQSFFSFIWKERVHKSEISGTSLGKEPLSTFFHHILPKSKYPKAALDPENIILLTPEEHDNVEIDIYRYEEINKRRETLKRKYDL